MKFVSKNANLRVVLKHGIPAEPLTGRQPISGVYIKFENGIAEINDEATADMMLNHPAFNLDYILLEENTLDPWKNRRQDNEPEHNISAIKYGYVEKNLNPKPQIGVNRDQKAAIDAMVEARAKEIALQMAPELAKKILSELASAQQRPAEDQAMAETMESPKTTKAKIKTKKTKKTSAKTIAEGKEEGSSEAVIEKVED